MRIEEGIAVKGLGGLYEVLLPSGERVSCRAKGILKRGEEKLYIGDRVRVQIDDEGKGETAVIGILPRRCALIRPPLANVTVMAVTASPKDPLPSYPTLDRLLAICEHEGITPLLAVTKCDAGRAEAEEFAALYAKAGFETYLLSSVTGEGIPAFRDRIAALTAGGGIAAFAGASGVGKSSLLSALYPGLALQTGALSDKTARGRHTTRAVELFPCGDGFVADTPGFSLLDFEHFDFMALSDLLPAFRDLLPYTGKCRYDDCTHTKEEGCAVLDAVAEGKIAKSRQESYAELYAILKAKKTYK